MNSYLYLDTELVWKAYLDTGLITRELDRLGNSKQIATRPLTDLPFTRLISCTPTVIRRLLGSKATRLHLGCLGLMCYLDKPKQWHAASGWLYHKGVNLHKLSHAMNFCIYIGVRKQLRSRPDIGRRYAKLLAGKKVGGG